MWTAWSPTIGRHRPKTRKWTTKSKYHQSQLSSPEFFISSRRHLILSWRKLSKQWVFTFLNFCIYLFIIYCVLLSDILVTINSLKNVKVHNKNYISLVLSIVYMFIFIDILNFLVFATDDGRVGDRPAPQLPHNKAPPGGKNNHLWRLSTARRNQQHPQLLLPSHGGSPKPKLPQTPPAHPPPAPSQH